MYLCVCVVGIAAVIPRYVCASVNGRRRECCYRVIAILQQLKSALIIARYNQTGKAISPFLRCSKGLLYPLLTSATKHFQQFSPCIVSCRFPAILTTTNTLSLYWLFNRVIVVNDVIVVDIYSPYYCRFVVFTSFELLADDCLEINAFSVSHTHRSTDYKTMDKHNISDIETNKRPGST